MKKNDRIMWECGGKRFNQNDIYEHRFFGVFNGGQDGRCEAGYKGNI